MKKEKKQKPISNVERFYEWLQKCGNVYLHDNEKVLKAFHKVANN